MKATGAALAGFAAGVALTVLVVNLIADRGADERGDAERAALRRQLDESKPTFAGDGSPAARVRPIDVAPVAVAPAAGAGTAELSADDRFGLLLYGLVTDPGGAPIDGQGWQSFSLTPESGPEKRAIVDEAGAYSVSGLRPGRWSLFAHMLGHLPMHDTVELSAQVPALRHDLVMQASTMLAVKAFTTDGRPILDALVADVGQGKTWGVGARVTALASTEALRAVPQYEGENRVWFGLGVFTSKWALIDADPKRMPQVPDDALGVLELDVPPPLWVSLASGSAILASQHVEAGATEVVFRLDVSDVMSSLATLDARFVDAETRAPLGGVRIEMDRQLPGAYKPIGDDGKLHCEKIAAGPLRMDVVLAGYERLAAKLSFSAGQHLDLGDVALSKGRTVAGQVFDEDGQPLRTLVSLRPLDQDPLRPFEEDWQSWRTEDDGRFDFHLVGRHRYALAISDRDHASPPIIVDTHLADATGLVLRAGAGAQVSVHYDWDSDQRHDVRLTNKDTGLVSDWGATSGSYVLTRRFLSGHYVVEVSDGATILLSRSFDVGTQPMDVALKP